MCNIDYDGGNSYDFSTNIDLLIPFNVRTGKLTLQKVTRAAEECSNLLSRIISPERSHVVLGPLIESEDFPINLAAVKMMTQIVEEAEASTVQSILSQITPSLLKVGKERFIGRLGG